MIEKWAPIKGHSGYEVSNLGQVRSLPRTIIDKNGKSFRKKGRLLKPGRNGSRLSYLGVSIGQNFHPYVHYLVCAAFHGPQPSPRHEVAHRDGNGFNNAATNLRWATKKENERDKIFHGTRTRGEQHGPAKLKERDVIGIRRMFAKGATLSEAATKFGTTIYNAYLIKHRKSWAWLHDPTPR